MDDVSLDMAAVLSVADRTSAKTDTATLKSVTPPSSSSGSTDMPTSSPYSLRECIDNKDGSRRFGIFDPNGNFTLFIPDKHTEDGAITEGLLHTKPGRPDVKYKYSLTSTPLRTEMRYNNTYPDDHVYDKNYLGVDQFKMIIPNGYDIKNLFFGRRNNRSWIDRKIVPGTYMIASYVSNKNIYHTFVHDRFGCSRFIDLIELSLKQELSIEGMKLIVTKDNIVASQPKINLRLSMRHYLVNVDTVSRTKTKRSIHPDLVTHVEDPTELDSHTRDWIFLTTNIKRFERMEINDVHQVVINRICSESHTLSSEAIILSDRLDDDINTAIVFRTPIQPPTRVTLLIDGEIVGCCLIESFVSSSDPKKKRVRGQQCKKLIVSRG